MKYTNMMPKDCYVRGSEELKEWASIKNGTQENSNQYMDDSNTYFYGMELFNNTYKYNFDHSRDIPKGKREVTFQEFIQLLKEEPSYELY